MLNFSFFFSLRSAIFFLALTLSFVISPICGFAVDSLEIVGTGDSQKLLREIARAYEASHPGIDVVIPDSIGSSGGIRAVIAGRNLLARVARPLSEEEKNSGLVSLQFGAAPTVFFVNKSVSGIETLDRDEITGIFSGEIRNWKTLGGPDNTIYLVNREHGDSSLRVLEQHIPGLSNFEHPDDSIFFSTPEAMEAIAQHADTIGYGPLSMQPAASNVIAYEGVFPSPENIASGAYPMVTPLMLVWKEDLPLSYRSFVDFLFSPAAAEIMMADGVWPSGGQK